MRYSYLVIEGNIGAGKTTLATRLAEKHGGRLILEQFEDNPFLAKFYADPQRYAFPLEMSFLAERYNQLKMELAHPELFSRFTVADYYFSKSLIFARNTLEQDEYRLYRDIFNILYPSLPRPDLYVYLHLPVERLMENIRKRGREYEKHITAEYLKKIQDGYFESFRYEKGLRILLLDTAEIDFVAYEEDYRKLEEYILERDYKPGVTRVKVEPERGERG